MVKNDINEVYEKQDINSRLRDIHEVLSISVSLANGMVWKEKTKSYYKVIARELKELFDNDLLSDVKFKKFKKKYLRIGISNNSLLFLKNNLFDSLEEEFLSKEEWLSQKFVTIEQKRLPGYLTSKEKEKIYEKSTDEEIEIINRNYNRQQLNSSNFVLNLISEDQEKLIDILNDNGYYSITVKEYIELLSSGEYNYNSTKTEQSINIFKNTINNYILELGAYVSKEIEKYLNK